MERHHPRRTGTPSDDWGVAGIYDSGGICELCGSALRALRLGFNASRARLKITWAFAGGYSGSIIMVRKRSISNLDYSRDVNNPQLRGRDLVASNEKRGLLDYWV